MGAPSAHTATPNERASRRWAALDLPKEHKQAVLSPDCLPRPTADTHPAPITRAHGAVADGVKFKESANGYLR